MPCRSDYLEPQGNEIASRKVAQLLVYLLVALGQTPPDKISIAANNSYGNPSYLEPMVQMLCGMLGAMSEERMNELVYNGRKREARELADWWEEHQKADEARKLVEEFDAKIKEWQRSGLAKLTGDEIKALGLSGLVGK